MKAILVIDMPSNCIDCQYCGWSSREKDMRACMLLEGWFFSGEDIENKRSVLCPLRPLSEKSDYLPKDDHAYSKAEIMAYTYGIAVGRNEVIDEILGEDE